MSDLPECQACEDGKHDYRPVIKWCTACNWSGDYPMTCNLCDVGESIPVPPTDLDIKAWPTWQEANRNLYGGKTK